MKYAYDLQHRLKQIQNLASATVGDLISQYDYSYDGGTGPDALPMKGMISSVTEQFKHTDQNLYGSYTTGYGYDSAYQLTSAAYPAYDATLNVPWSGQRHEFGYDQIGNRSTYKNTDSMTLAGKREGQVCPIGMPADRMRSWGGFSRQARSDLVNEGQGFCGLFSTCGNLGSQFSDQQGVLSF